MYRFHSYFSFPVVVVADSRFIKQENILNFIVLVYDFINCDQRERQ